jgi:hypothetical protein
MLGLSFILTRARCAVGHGRAWPRRANTGATANMVSSSASSRLSCGSSRVAATAAITSRRWSAFWKIPYERPCEVDVVEGSESDVRGDYFL